MTDNRPSGKLKRTILYYPTISIPTGTWVRQALLYWDEIGSIVPQRWDDFAFIPYPPDIEYLRAEGEFRPIRPEALTVQPNGRESRQAFEKEFRSAVTSVGFQRLLGPKHEWRLVSQIHCAKVSAGSFDFLAREGLAAVVGEHPGWYLFEDRTALLYMSLLAKYLADIDLQATVPGTDRREYEKLIYDAPSRRRGFACLDTRFRNALPIPQDDVPLSDIVEFKRKRRAELLNFRQQIDHFHQQLAQAENRPEVKQIATSFAESVEKGLNDLGALLADAKMATATGSLKTIMNLKSPMFWGAVVAVVGQAAKVTELPIEWTLPGLGVLGSIQVGCYLIDQRNERRAALRKSAFAYLYHARAEGLL